MLQYSSRFAPPPRLAQAEPSVVHPVCAFNSAHILTPPHRRLRFEHCISERISDNSDNSNMKGLRVRRSLAHLSIPTERDSSAFLSPAESTHSHRFGHQRRRSVAQQHLSHHPSLTREVGVTRTMKLEHTSLVVRVAPAEHGDALRPREAAALLQVNTRTLARWAASGRIGVTITPGGHRRYPRADVAALLRSCRTEFDSIDVHSNFAPH